MAGAPEGLAPGTAGQGRQAAAMAGIARGTTQDDRRRLSVGTTSRYRRPNWHRGRTRRDYEQVVPSGLPRRTTVWEHHRVLGQTTESKDCGPDRLRA